MSDRLLSYLQHVNM